MTDLNRAIIADWMLTKFGQALFIMGLAPLVAAFAAVAVDDPQVAWFGALGPVIAGLFLMSLDFPKIVHDDDEDGGVGG